jgi:hypothetical protein
MSKNHLPQIAGHNRPASLLFTLFTVTCDKKKEAKNLHQVSNAFFIDAH